MMGFMKKISVIIPVYNVQDYLSACLDSVLDQTFQDFEIICVNDGSTDGSADILNKYAEQDNRVKVFTQKNQGQGVARNTGLDAMNGEYVLFLDSDDRLPNYALDTLLKIAQETKAPIVVSRRWTHEFQPLDQSISYQLHKDAFHDFVSDTRIFSSPWNKLYRADILKAHRFISGIYFEDWPFLTTLFGQIDFYATTEIPCYIYNESNISTIRSSFTLKKVNGYLTGIRYVYDFYKDRPELILAQKRLAVAVKMMLNKVYKSKDKDLRHYTLSQVDDLFQKGIIKKRHLPLKTLFRLWKMRRMK